MIADEIGVCGLLCLGYPFHPPGRPERARIAHLQQLATAALFLQGTRDPFGSVEDVAGYPLSPSIHIHWLADGDHGFKPRASTGRTELDNYKDGLNTAVAWLARLTDDARRHR